MAGQGALDLAQYTIGEVETITGIKPHVLRYWEENVSLFNPQKDSGGHRVYTQREIDIICRLKYLIYTRHFTIQGAEEQLLHEMEEQNPREKALFAIRKCRAELDSLFLQIKKINRREREK